MTSDSDFFSVFFVPREDWQDVFCGIIVVEGCIEGVYDLLVRFNINTTVNIVPFREWKETNAPFTSVDHHFVDDVKLIYFFLFIHNSDGFDFWVQR